MTYFSGYDLINITSSNMDLKLFNKYVYESSCHINQPIWTLNLNVANMLHVMTYLFDSPNASNSL